MKKTVLVLLSIMTLIGCNMSNTPTKKTEEVLTKYQSLSDEVMLDLELSAETENLSSSNLNTYVDVVTRQYQNLKYEITNEQVNGDEAVVTAKITVYDLYKTMQEVNQYYKDNPKEFEIDGVYSQEKYTTYQLTKMLETTQVVDYSIDFYLEKVDDEWKMQELSDATKEKIHGTYDYENE